MDDWLKRFLEHNDLNVQESLSMLWESCDWRKKFGCNDITEHTVRRDYLEEGIFFSHNKDKDGKFLFIVKSKLHVKGAKDFKELQRCIVYWFERLEREGNGNQISLVFDMADTGLNNMDMEFTKYLIGLFKTYYPNFLNYIIIYEMPWILNAAFKVIKSWLPAKAIPKIKFVNKSNMKEFIEPNDALKCWGGNDDYTFTFLPEVRTAAAVMNGRLENKKVHFAEGSPMSEQATSGFGDQSNEERMLSVDPESITFNKEGNEVSGTITLKNLTTDKCLSYKIKTTSPEKFRVRPSTGIVMPTQECNVMVTLQPGYNVHGLLRNDRFLVMCLPMKDTKMTSQELTEFWKTGGKGAEQHRLGCTDGGTENGEVRSSILSNSAAASDRGVDKYFSKITQLEDNHRQLHVELTNMKRLQIISIMLTVLLAMAIVYILRSDIRNAAEEQYCHMHHGVD
ncbi:motile sperm domain-containing protein 2 isoform X2 [Cephus cinctus]|nr:motile sperm domain-containing protein 2 isoform X2 [Cephus cinctus]